MEVSIISDKKKVRNSVVKEMTDKNGNITFPTPPKNNSDPSGSSEHDQAVRRDVQEHLLAQMALTQKFFQE